MQSILPYFTPLHINTLGTGSTNLSFYGSAVVDRGAGPNLSFLSHVRFESIIHCSVAPQLGGSSWVTSLRCLFMDIGYVTPLLSCLGLKKGLWSPSQPSCLQSASSLLHSAAFCKQRIVRVKTFLMEKVILPELLSDNFIRCSYNIFNHSESDSDVSV
jgi:hypothetical protein